jgi:fucose permease
VTAFSVLLTAIALAGFGLSTRFWMLCLWAVPYGLGAGAVDAALNNYVALHYSSRHMNWLHCFWGVGVTISPYIMSFCLFHQLGWHAGYNTVAVLQFILTAGIFMSLPLWNNSRKVESTTEQGTSVESDAPVGLRKALAIPGVKSVLGGFMCYCGMESTAILWACSFLAIGRGFENALAARYGALLFMGIMLGRFLSGFISVRLGDRNMIRLGITIAILGTVMLLLPWHVVCLTGLLLLGLGCAPIYPSIIHQTPTNFGVVNSQAIIGIQMASAYVGSTLVPPIFGYIAQHTTMQLFPYFLLLFMVPLFLLLENLNHTIDCKL